MQYRPVRDERGAVLVVSLVILLVMTVIGVTSMQTVVLGEKMAGNLRDRNTAFQAGEAGLQVSLSWLDDKSQAPAADGSLLFDECETKNAEATTNCPEKTFPSMDWLVHADRVEYADVMNGVNPLVGVSRQPRVAVEQRYAPPLQFEAVAGGTGPHFFTATAVGYGTTQRAVSALQTTVLKVFAW